MKGKGIGKNIVYGHIKDKLLNDNNNKSHDVGSSSSLLMIHEECNVKHKDNMNSNEYRLISQSSVNDASAVTSTSDNNSGNDGGYNNIVNKSTPLLKGLLTRDKITGAFVWEGEWGMDEEAFNKNIISGFKYRSVSYILKDLSKRRSPRASSSQSLSNSSGLVVANPSLNDRSVQPYKIFFNGHFTLLAKSSHGKTTKHAERHIELILEPPHQDGSTSTISSDENNRYSVKGCGINIFGMFELRGHYDPDSGALVCHKAYTGRLNPSLTSERSKNPITGPGEILVYTLTADANPISLRPPNSGQFTSKHVHFSKILEIIQTLCKQDQASNWFSLPIDPIALNSLDYFEIVKRPMDLGTIKRQLEMHMYNNLNEVLDDIRLTFSNALLYNPRGSVVVKAATSMLENFEVLIKKRLNVQTPSSSSTATPPSSDSTSKAKPNHQSKPSTSSVENKATIVDTILTNSGKRKRNPKVSYEPEEMPRCIARNDKSRKRNRTESNSDESNESDSDSESSRSRDHNHATRGVKARSSFSMNGSAPSKRSAQMIKQKIIKANPLRSESIIRLSKEMVKNSGKNSNYNSILSGASVPPLVPGVAIGKSIFDRMGLYDPIDESNDQDVIASPMISFAVSAFDAADNNPTEALLLADYDDKYDDEGNDDENFADDISDLVDDENGNTSATVASPSMRSLASDHSFFQSNMNKTSPLPLLDGEDAEDQFSDTNDEQNKNLVSSPSGINQIDAISVIPYLSKHHCQQESIDPPNIALPSPTKKGFSGFENAIELRDPSTISSS